jgi:SAM-dependent methyltransferase
MKCHICNQETQSFVDEKTDIIYYHCPHCHYIFKSPEYFQDIAVQKVRYDLHENDEEDTGYQAYFQRFLDFVLPLVGETNAALDFGCGATSLLAKMLEEQGIPCDYYDPIYHPNSLDEFKKYDLIVSTEVFEHLHNPREVFKDLLERLEEGGYLALQTQFHTNNLDDFKKWYYHQDPTHIVFFTAHTFKVLCKEYDAEFVSDNGKNIVLIKKPADL